MDFTPLYPLIATLGTALGIGLAEGRRYYASRKNGQKSEKHPGVDMSSDPPSLLNPRLTKSGRWPGLSEMCPECPAMKEKLKNTSSIAHSVQAAAAAAASAASMASSATMRMEEQMHEEGERTRSEIKELSITLGGIREWKGRVEGDVDHITGQIAALWNEVRR